MLPSQKPENAGHAKHEGLGQLRSYKAQSMPGIASTSCRFLARDARQVMFLGVNFIVPCWGGGVQWALDCM